jgi:hypothetical protein
MYPKCILLIVEYKGFQAFWVSFIGKHYKYISYKKMINFKQTGTTGGN